MFCKRPPKSLKLRYVRYCTNRNVGIVGGGMSGIGTLKELNEMGFNCTLFEYSNDIGGNWDVNNDITGGYPGMISNSSYTVWPFSDYIFDCKQNEKHSLLTRIDQTHQHLSNYAKYFNLYKDIQFNSNVTNIINTDHNKWEITINNNNKYIFDRIVLCNGLYSFPSYPQHLNLNNLQNSFNGDIYHSRDLKKITKESMNDKNILVVGNSFSACDVTEFACSANSKYVYMLYREAKKFLKFWDTNGTLIASHINARNNPIEIADFALQLDEYGFITPDVSDDDKFKITLCKSIDYFCCQGILQGIHGQIDSVLNGKDILLTNGNIINDIDMIIFATGYDINQTYRNILPIDIINKFYNVNIKTNRHLLYLLTFIPGYKTDNIAFVGGYDVLGAILYEIQSRLIGQVWSNNVLLPENDEQHKWVKQKLIDFDPYWYATVIPVLPYIDDIAKFIGILPNKDDYGKEYEYIYNQLKWDIVYTPQYRMIGHGSNKNKSIKLLDKLIKTNKNESKEIQEYIGGIESFKKTKTI